TPPMTDHRAITDAVAGPIADRRAGKAWWAAFGASLAIVLAGATAAGLSFEYGPGLWGNNSAVVWGFPISSYVWWIGIGNAGTLISAMLLLTRQKWRSSINRFAETMTIFAVAIAGIYPILHLGRPMYFYWMAPYPSTMHIWPQWRSALVWDFWSILSYLLFSILFFYLGLIPDLATLRDRPGSRIWRKIWGVAALGWQGTPAQWRTHTRLQWAMAAIATPLVCSVHSIVGLDFAASIMPGWIESIFPPYFVVGAFFSGFAVVVLMAMVIRRALDLEGMIRPSHLDAMAKVILASACVMGLSYTTEWLSALWTGEASSLRFLRFSFTGPYLPFQILMLIGNVFLPQLFWSPKLRRNPIALAIIAFGILIGMYLERVQILTNSLSIGWLPAMWTLYVPTIIDFLILAGALSFWVLLVLVTARVLPLVSIYEVRALAEEAKE
ncbi:MAG TPA: NrfD/PsrC family molybdoenzyme membrane anchor subunit, partial [Sphingomonas sp.]|nr:NrfD/PsrC family molybdoenzyme membrane anchor subunit [Sphingomonas sp.]